MQCYACDSKISKARKVKLRVVKNFDPRLGGPDSAAFISYKEDTTFRWAVICEECYCCIDNYCGVEAIGFNSFNLAGVSRAEKATIIDEAKYFEFQRREAMKLRIDLKGPN